MPLGAKKSLVRKFGVGGDFHPLRQLLHCHNIFVANKNFGLLWGCYDESHHKALPE